MGYPGRGSKKFFWNSGLAPIDFSCPKTPKYQKSANLEKKKFFSEIGPQTAPPENSDPYNFLFYRRIHFFLFSFCFSDFPRSFQQDRFLILSFLKFPLFWFDVGGPRASGASMHVRAWPRDTNFCV